MEFVNQTAVKAADGKDVGRVDRVVLNPKTKEVTHIVVRKGFLFTEDKIVPLNLISAATKDEVRLRSDAGDLSKLPPFEDSHYVPLNPNESRSIAYAESLAMPLYWYPPAGGWMAYDYPLPFTTETTQNIPEDTVAVREGARIYTSDDKDMGHVERIFTDSKSKRATYFLLTHGLLTKSHKLIPMTWVRHVSEDEVRLNVGSALINDLREYEEMPSR